MPFSCRWLRELLFFFRHDIGAIARYAAAATPFRCRAKMMILLLKVASYYRYGLITPLTDIFSLRYCCRHADAITPRLPFIMFYAADTSSTSCLLMFAVFMMLPYRLLLAPYLALIFYIVARLTLPRALC